MRNKKYFFNRILLSMAVVCSWSAILNSHNAFAQTYSLKLSYSSNRSNPVSLTNQKVAGNIYVFTSPDTNVKQVKFYINKPAGSGTPYMTENLLPFDLAGTATNGTANAYDSHKLPEGSSSISAIITLKDSTTVSLQSFFTVDNVPDTQCGNGIVEAGEECEGSTTQACTINGYSGLKTCSSCHYGSCVATQYCGDGIKNGMEGCDDGNTANGDGCSSTCTVETPPISYNLMLSSSANRSNPVLLSNKTVAGNIYVYTSPDTNVKQVSFYINKPAGSGTPDKIEGLPPFDLAGTATMEQPIRLIVRVFRKAQIPSPPSLPLLIILP